MVAGDCHDGTPTAMHDQASERNGHTMNDTEREQWIDNDEGLYDWWRTSRLGKRAFIRANRAAIDEVIRNVTGSVRPAHYLKYGW
jgi:hypothetical protein